MKLKALNDKSKYVNVNVEFGTKMGHSPYIVSKTINISTPDDIMYYFLAATLEDAVKKVVRTGMLSEHKKLYLITGDGQEIELSIEDDDE